MNEKREDDKDSEQELSNIEYEYSEENKLTRDEKMGGGGEIQLEN